MAYQYNICFKFMRNRIPYLKRQDEGNNKPAINMKLNTLKFEWDNVNPQKKLNCFFMGNCLPIQLFNFI